MKKFANPKIEAAYRWRLLARREQLARQHAAIPLRKFQPVPPQPVSRSGAAEVLRSLPDSKDSSPYEVPCEDKLDMPWAFRR